MIRLRPSALIATTTLLACGCQEAGTAYVPVSGRVTLDGEPLADAIVTFRALDAPAGVVGSAKTDARGRYRLRSLTPQRERIDGGAVGRHRVTITSKVIEYDDVAGDRVVRAEVLPAIYHEESVLEVEVPPGGDADCDFELMPE